MAAPIYKQAVADALIVLPKFIEYDAWSKQFPSRPTVGETSHRVKALPRDTNDFSTFTVECRYSFGRPSVSFTLFGSVNVHHDVPLCRYDFQIGRHKNPAWFSPRWVQNRELHKHVYSERAIRENLSWDACAMVLSPPVESYQKAVNLLTPIFLQECKIEVHDPDAMQGLFAKPT